MKQFVLIMVCLGFVTVAQAENLGVLSTSDNVIVWCKAVSSTGTEQSADSGHVVVSFNREATANSASYSASWTNAGASGTYIDSVRYNSHTYYYFTDAVADIDNDEGNGPYYGDVILYTGGLPWHNKFTFTLAGDEFSDYLAMVKACLDTLNLHDNWVAPASGLLTVSDIFDADTAGHKTAGSFGQLLSFLDTLNNLLAIADIASEVADSIVVNRTVGARLDYALAWLRDSLPVFLTVPGNGTLPWADRGDAADADTLFLGVGTDTIYGVRYPHPGGSPGDPPTQPVTSFRW